MHRPYSRPSGSRRRNLAAVQPLSSSWWISWRSWRCWWFGYGPSLSWPCSHSPGVLALERSTLGLHGRITARDQPRRVWGERLGPRHLRRAALGKLRADIDRRTDVGHRIELLGKARRQADAAVAGGVTRVVSGMHRDAVGFEELGERHRRVVIFVRMVHHRLVEHREDAGRGRLVVAAGRDGRRRHQGVAPIEVGHLIRQADDDAFGTRALGDVAPDILSWLDDLRAEGVDKIDARLGRSVARFHPGFVGFQRGGRRNSNGTRKYARTRQRQRNG